MRPQKGTVGENEVLILEELSEEPNYCQRLVRNTGKHQSSINTALKRLEMRGLVERIQSMEFGKVYQLTDQGWKKIKKKKKVFD